MPDRLSEVEANLHAIKTDEHTYDHYRLDKVRAVQDLYWCVREIYRLKGLIRALEEDLERSTL